MKPEAAIESKRKEIERQEANEAKILHYEREEGGRQTSEKTVLEMPADKIVKLDVSEIMAMQVKGKKELQVHLRAQETRANEGGKRQENRQLDKRCLDLLEVIDAL